VAEGEALGLSELVALGETFKERGSVPVEGAVIWSGSWLLGMKRK
jgi:hypothetical protein